MADKEKKKGGIGKWFREFRSEFKKVVWPSAKQLKNNTIVVIVMVLVITALIFAFDSGFKALVGLVVPDYNSSVIDNTGNDSDNNADENNNDKDDGDGNNSENNENNENNGNADNSDNNNSGENGNDSPSAQ